MRRNLFEEENDSPVAGTMKDPGPPSDSLDSEIDARIVRYENESLKDEAEEEGEELLESLKNLSLRFLFEEEEAPEAQAPAQQKSSDATQEPEPKLPLDIDAFTSKIARLINHAEELLPVREVIVTRAMNYLRDNYDQSYADQMQSILDQQYGFDLTGKEDIIDVPIAAGAGTKSAGG